MKSTYLGSKDIAILIATYNGEKHLTVLLDSIIAQTANNYVCYIHDDGSTDRTLTIINEYAERYSDIIHIVDGEAQGGAKNNFLYLLENVECEYYMFCDQDDYWLPDKVEKSYKALSKKPEDSIMCVYTDLQVANDRLEIINESFYKYTKLNPLKNSYKELLMNNVCVGCTMMFNRNLRNMVINIRSNNIIMHDWLVALMASLFGEMIYLDHPTVMYRQHDSNSIGAAREFMIFRKMKRALFDIKGFFERSKYFRERPRKIANDLKDLPVSEDKSLFLKDFSDIGHKKKIYRIRFYFTEKLYRQGISKLWQLMWV